jgi:PAS domain S-box-containing protein
VDKRYNIIVLEKDPTEVELIEMQLRKAGLRYATKRIGNSEMLQDAAKESPPDLILANFTLPRFDVTSVILHSRSFIPGVPWVVYSLTGNEEAAVQCMKAGASDFILKKHIARFGASVKEILESSAALKIVPRDSESPRAKEQKAEKSELPLYRQIVEHAPDLIAVLNLEGRREYNNPMYGEVVEDPEILVGTDSFLDILPEDRDRIRQLFKDVIVRGYGEQTEYRLLDKSGETRFIQSNSSVIPGPDGDPEKVVVVSRDITPQVVMRQRFEHLIATTAGLTGQDFFDVLVHRLSEALGAGCGLASYMVDEGQKRVRSLAFWVGGTVRQALEYDAAQMPCERVIAGGETVVFANGVSSLFPKMSEIVGMPIESYVGSPLQDQDGVILGHLFVANKKPLDQPDRAEFIVRLMARRASVELQRASAAPAPPREERAEDKDLTARLRTAIEGLPMPVVMTNEGGTIVIVNGELEELVGIGATDLVGRRAWPLILRGGPWKLLKEEYSDLVVRPDKTSIPVSVYAIPCRNAEGRISGTMGILTQTREPKVPASQ